ncbi:hypothetical protein CANCADRAFT_15260, partial [Tortispora caseinolytica NRRL Y-17796]
PIVDLSPFQNAWSIRARVVNKSEVREYTNKSGVGRVMSLILSDKSGEIEMSAFGELADKIYNEVEVDSTYDVSRARVQTARNQYRVKNAYCLYANNDTSFERVAGTSNMGMQFNFTPLADLPAVPPGQEVDILAAIDSVDPITEITSRATQKKFNKREVHCVDDTGYKVPLTLWSKDAENFNAPRGTIIAVRHAKVSDFGGRSLNASQHGFVLISPDIPQSHALAGWYESRKNQEFKVMERGQQSEKVNATKGQRLTVEEVIKESDKLTDPTSAIFVDVVATVLYVSTKSTVYSSCPNPDCRVKRTMSDIGEPCSKCGQMINDLEYHYVLNLSIGDPTGEIWVTAFDNPGITLMGMTGTQLQNLGSEGSEPFKEVMYNAISKQYVFRLKLKQDTYNGETRVRITAVGAKPVDFKEDGKALVHELESL